MALTLQQLTALLSMNLGYLSSNDVAQWCDPQVIQGRINIQPFLLSKSAQMAYSEVVSKLQNVYDLTSELAKTDTVPGFALATLAAAAPAGIGAPIITIPGSNYIAPPVVTISRAAGDTTGGGAALTAQISGCTVTGIQVLSGGRRYINPQVMLVGGGGNGATAIAVMLNGMITGIQVTNPGNGYTSAPTVQITDSVNGNGSGAFAVALVTYGSLTGFGITNAGAAYTLPPILSLSSGPTIQLADSRNPKLVKIMSIFAVRNLLGSMQNISEKMAKDFEQADCMIEDLRSGQDSLPIFAAARKIRTELEIVTDRFKRLG